MAVFFNVFIIKTVGKGHRMLLRPLFSIGVWHIKRKRRAWLRWLYNLLGRSKWKNDICKSGYHIALVFARTVYDPVLRTWIKTRNFVTFYKFLILLGVNHTTLICCGWTYGCTLTLLEWCKWGWIFGKMGCGWGWMVLWCHGWGYKQLQKASHIRWITFLDDP